MRRQTRRMPTATPRRALYADDPALGWIPGAYVAPLIGFALVVIPIALTSSALAHFGLVDPGDNPVGAVGFYAFLGLTFGTIGLVMLGWVRLVERRSFATIGLTRSIGLEAFAAGLAVGIVMTGIIVAASSALGAFHIGTVGPAWTSPSALLEIFLLLIGFALQSSFEEIVFRGWLLSVLARRFSIAAAMIVSSLLFTLVHYNPDQGWIFNSTVLLYALFACSWVLNTRNIWGVMGWHAGWNWAFATGYELRVTGPMSPPSSSSSSRAAPII
jgi:uncharacterized protein